MNKTKSIAYGGMITLLSVVSLYCTGILPTNKLLFLALSSFLLGIIVLDYGIKQSLLVYIATSLLSLILVPNKVIVILYVVYFGYYGILKSLIEKLNNLFLEWILKLLSFNIAMVGTYLLASKLLFGSTTSILPLWALYIGIQPLFILFDYMFSLAIKFYKARIRNRI